MFMVSHKVSPTQGSLTVLTRRSESYARRARLFLLLTLTFLSGLFSTLPDAIAQKKTPPSKKKANTKKSDQLEVKSKLPNYYRIVGLGSAEPDSLSPSHFPYPMAIFQVLDTSRYSLRVRFPAVGVLGAWEDTLSQPNYIMNDSILAYHSREQFFRLAYPQTPYLVLVDVFDKKLGKFVETRPLPYNMSVEKYAGSADKPRAAFQKTFEPTTGMGSPTLQRKFVPTLLPLTIGANPGWRSQEKLDTNGVYSLTFKEPSKPDEVALTLTMRPTGQNKFDSLSWTNFKDRARIAFGTEGIAVSTLGDFNVDDSLTRSVIFNGYEFLSKRTSGVIDYVATYLTPRAILLLIAPIGETEEPIKLAYYQSIARSLAVGQKFKD
jgi:hypothetical protein